MPNLTKADMAEYQITFRTPGVPVKKVRAAYVATEAGHPDKLAFKDHQNRTVCLVSREDALIVDRLEQQGECADSGSRPEAAGAAHYWTGAIGTGIALSGIGCRSCGAQVPVDCGDVTGMTLDGMIKAAEAQAEPRCPAHETVRIGA